MTINMMARPDCAVMGNLINIHTHTPRNDSKDILRQFRTEIVRRKIEGGNLEAE